MRTKNSEERNRVSAEEMAVVQCQLLLQELLDERGWSRADLARAMNVSRARITQIFSDECSNLTVRFLARALFAFDERFALTADSHRSEVVDDAQCDIELLSNVFETKAWTQVDDYTSSTGAVVANDNIFGGLASLRQIGEESYRLAA